MNLILGEITKLYPFSIEEIKIVLILAMDIDQLISLYYSNKDILNRYTTLLRLSKRFNISYEGSKYGDGVRTTRQLVKSFSDMVFYIYLKDELKRIKLYIPNECCLKIAIQLRDYRLFKSLFKKTYDSSSVTMTTDYSIIGLGIRSGTYNNQKMIKLILSLDICRYSSVVAMGIVSGLIQGCHNKTFHKYLGKYNLQQGSLFYPHCFYHIVLGNNVKIFREYYNQIWQGYCDTITSYPFRFFELLAANDRDELLRIIVTNNEQHLPRILTADENYELFLGYLRGGHYIKAVSIFGKLCDYDLDSQSILTSVLKSDNIDCYLFVEKKFMLTHDDIIKAIKKVHILSDVVWYIINNDRDKNNSKGMWQIVLSQLIFRYDDEVSPHDLIKIVRQFDANLSITIFLVKYIMMHRLDKIPHKYFMYWLSDQTNQVYLP